MSEHHINLEWKRETKDFDYETYNRNHAVTFGGNQRLKTSSAPDFKGDANLTNPEELLAASVSTCHMLTFLAVASKSKITINSYKDHATAILEKNSEGKMAVTKIFLKPKIEFGENAPDAAKLKSLHDKAHHNCMIANSVKCEVVVVE